MWAVKNRLGYLAVFDWREDAEQWLRDWVSLHGRRAWVIRTER